MKIFTMQRIGFSNRLAGSRAIVACAWILAIVAPASAADVAWITVHPADNMPSMAAADVGFTAAPDKGYTDLLAANGHSVTRVISSGTPNVTQLNAFDLVIIGRSVNSGDYETDAETAAWQSIGAPMILMNGFTIRNNRLGFTTGGTMVDTTSSLKLTVNDTGHPIFAGLALDGGNTMVNDYASIVTFNSVEQRGISVNTNSLAAGGTVLATAPLGMPAVAATFIGQWAPGGSTSNSPPDIVGGHRLAFLSGSREPDMVSGDTAGILDLSADGQQMFVNAVNYMAGLAFFVPGDVNGDGVANINDYIVIRNHFQQSGGLADGDLNADGLVNFADFRRWKDNRTAGAGAAVGQGGSIPEPTSIALLLTGAVALLGAVVRRRIG